MIIIMTCRDKNPWAPHFCIRACAVAKMVVILNAGIDQRVEESVCPPCFNSTLLNLTWKMPMNRCFYTSKRSKNLTMDTPNGYSKLSWTTRAISF